MRLRLVINRHGLSPTKIWWDTSSFQPGDDKTVSSLLTRVSQIAPLESSKWGLEDYVVEIDGFEVLHFQEVGSVIREGDEVVVRPLSGTEIKQRRLSGRRQISTSGRKLIDGTPFGRSFLRPAPDRPNSAIHPRKRRKLGQIGADDAVTVQVDNETDDDSYNEDEGEGEEWKEEEEDSDDVNSEELGKVIERQLIPAGDITMAKHAPALEEAEGDGGEYDNPLMDYFYDEISEREPNTLNEVSMGDDLSAGDDEESEENYRNPEDQEEDMQFEANHDPETILDAGVDSYDSSEDGDFDPDSFHTDSSEEGNKELSRKKLPAATILDMTANSSDESGDECFDPHIAISDAESSGGEESEVESEYTSSGSSSDLGSESESESELGGGNEKQAVFQTKGLKADKPKKKSIARQHSSSSSTSSSSSSGSSSLSPETPEPQQSVPPKVPKGPPVAPGTAPYQGKKSTKARNKRKSEKRKLKKLVEQGVLPEGTTHAGYLEHIAGKQTHELLKRQPEPQKQLIPLLEESEKLNNNNTSIPASRRKRYRKAFVRAKKNGTVPEGQGFDIWIEEREKRRGVENEKDVNQNVGQASTTADEAPVEESSKQKDVPGRPSVNLDVLRRTVIHDLATSKKRIAAATAEELMRKEWVQICHKDATNKRKGFAREQYGKPPKKIIYDNDGNPMPADAENIPEALAEPEDPNAWRKKLALTAVECEWEGVELPSPSFPFKQPPFQNLGEIAGNKRKRKGGKGKRQQQSQQHEYWGHEDRGYGQDDGYHHQQQSGWTYNYYDDTTQVTDGNQAEDTIMEEPGPIHDLPPLPEDINSLFPLTKPVLPQTIIAFKQLTMDANYAPILADYRTAVVDEVDDQAQDGPFLVLKLAIRDRMKRHVDKETGEKVLRKFEMPGNEDDDDGRIELMFGELLEPKVLKLPEAAEVKRVQGEMDEKGDGGNGGERAIDGTVGNADADETINTVQEGRQGLDSNEEGRGTPASGQDEAPVESVAIVDRETIRADVVVGKVASPRFQSPEDNAVIEHSQEQHASPRADVPVVLQATRTNSPVYSQGHNEFQTPEPEAQRDIATVDDDYQPPIINDEGVYESDSDGLPTLESILASQSQRALIKRESTQVDDESQLPPLPQFSPFGMKVSDDTVRSFGGERPLDEQQIQHEVEGARKSKPVRPNKSIGSSQAKVIDLTMTSSDPPVEKPQRGKPRGRKTRRDHRRL